MTRRHAPPRWLDLAGALLLALLIRHYADALGVRDDVQLSFLNFIITGVAAAFGWLADKAVTVAVVVWHATRIVGTALVRFGVGLGGILGKVYGLLGSFWRGVLRPLIQYTWTRIDQLTAWLRHTLAPAFRFLELVRRRLWAIYDRYFRPIFDTIELTRRILQLLATFRLEWARELDRKLAELEDRLLYPIREAMLWLNRAMDVLNRIVTLDGLLQRVTLIRSMWRYVGDAWAVLLSHTPEGTSAAEIAAKREQEYPLESAQRLQRALGDWYRAGGGELAPGITAAAAQWKESP